MFWSAMSLERPEGACNFYHTVLYIFTVPLHYLSQSASVGRRQQEDRQDPSRDVLLTCALRSCALYIRCQTKHICNCAIVSVQTRGAQTKPLRTGRHVAGLGVDPSLVPGGVVRRALCGIISISNKRTSQLHPHCHPHSHVAATCLALPPNCLRTC